MGSPMALLWPNGPLRAVPEYVMDVRLSTPMAFDAAATTGLAFCAAVPTHGRLTNSAAIGTALIGIALNIRSSRLCLNPEWTRSWRLIHVAPPGNLLAGNSAGTASMAGLR